MIKELNKKFISTIILYSSYFVVGAGVLGYAYYKTGGGNLVVTGIFIYLLISIFVTSWVTNRLNYISNLSYIVRINSNSGDPQKITRVNNTQVLYQYLEANDFVKHINDSEHYLFYRVKRDMVKKIFKLYMLEVVVYINKDSSDFYLDQVNDEINAIKDKLRKDKKTVNRLFVTQYKVVDELDEITKNAISEIVFIRTKYHIVSTINVGILNNELAVMLYSDTYSPSLYYKYHIDQIKEML